MSAIKNAKTEYHILLPTSARAYIKRNCTDKPLRSPDSPRIVCDLQLDDVSLKLVDVSKKHIQPKYIGKLLYFYFITDHSQLNLLAVAVRANCKVLQRS